MKLKIPKLDWKGKTLKLRRIILSSAPLVEVDRAAIDLFDFMRRAVRGEVGPEETAFPALPASVQNLVWEPYSDAKGDVELIYGWELGATMYCVDGKPWWLVRAHNKLDVVPARAVAEIECVVDFLGADVQRDRIMNIAFGGGNGHTMWWTWINQFPLMETQVRKKPLDMRIVEEGSPVPPGYVRIPRVNPRDVMG